MISNVFLGVNFICISRYYYGHCQMVILNRLAEFPLHRLIIIIIILKMNMFLFLDILTHLQEMWKLTESTLQSQITLIPYLREIHYYSSVSV